MRTNRKHTEYEFWNMAYSGRGREKTRRLEIVINAARKFFDIVRNTELQRL